MTNIFRDIAERFNIVRPQEFVKDLPVSYAPKKLPTGLPVAPRKDLFSGIGKRFGIDSKVPIAPLQTFIKRKQELELGREELTTREKWQQLGELTKEVALAIPRGMAIGGAKLGLTTRQFIETIKTGKAPEPVKVPRLLKPIYGEEITSYAKDVEDDIKAGKNPVAAVLKHGLFMVWDVAILGSILKYGVSSILKGKFAPKVSQQAAWEAMGRPATKSELKQQYRSLAQKLHPDKPTGSHEAFVSMNNSYKILEKQGIPKEIPRPQQIIKEIATILDTPISEIMKTKTGQQYFGLKGLIPERAGFRPLEPFQEFRPVRAGLMVERKPMIPIEPEMSKSLEKLEELGMAMSEFMKFEPGQLPTVAERKAGKKKKEELFKEREKKEIEFYNSLNPKYKIGDKVNLKEVAEGQIGKQKEVEIIGIDVDITLATITQMKTGFPTTFEFKGFNVKDKEGYTFLTSSNDIVNGEKIIDTIGIKPKDVLREFVRTRGITEEAGEKLLGIKPTEELPPTELYEKELGREPTLEEVIEEDLDPRIFDEEISAEEYERIIRGEAELEATPIDSLITGMRRIRIPTDTKKDWLETLGKGRLLKISTTDPTASSADEFASELGMTERELLEAVDNRFETRKEFKVEKVKGERKVYEAAPKVKAFKLPKLPEKAVEPLQRLMRAVRSAKMELPDIAEAHRRERAIRAKEVELALEEGGEQAYIKALGKLKGELIERPTIKGIREKLSQEDIDELFIAIQQSPLLDVYEKISAQAALGKIMSEIIPTKSELKLLEEVFGSDLIKGLLAKRGKWVKIYENLIDIANWPRVFMTSFDASAVLRQGIIPTISHPILASKAFKEMFRQAFSKERFERWLFEIKQTPEYKFAKKQGLYIADATKIAGGLSEREERFMTNLLQKVPVLGKLIEATERAYTSYLNKLRFDIYNQITKKFQREGIIDDKVYKSLADYVNNATGRGNLGKTLERIAPPLNAVFFSPRLIAARFNFLNPIWYAKMPRPVRMEALKSFAEFVGVGISILLLAKLGGAEVEEDPRSSDFGKIRVGNTRWDIWGGFQQFARVFSQLATGQRKTTTKKEILELSKDVYPFETRLDVAFRFLGGKLSPTISLIGDIIRGQKLFGDELTLEKELVEKTIPLYLQDIKEAYDELGAWGLLSVGLPGFFGVGTQTYEPRMTKRKKKSDIGIPSLEMPSLKMEGLKFPELKF